MKSQTIAIYRKLGTSSRSGAVQAAVAAGLLEPRRPRQLDERQPSNVRRRWRGAFGTSATSSLSSK